MDLTNFKKLSEEPLKSAISKAFFEYFDFSGDKIDFIISYNHKNKNTPPEPVLWAEGKRGKSDLFKSFIQLILTIGKHKFHTHFPPPFLGAFDAFCFAFVPYYKLDFIFTRSDIDFQSPSNHNTWSFKNLSTELTPLLEKEALIFNYATQSKELKTFIKENLLYSKRSKISIDKNNFVHVYFKWVDNVKSSINMDWEDAKKEGILDADFYLADLLSENNRTKSILENLNVLLESNFYTYNEERTKRRSRLIETTEFDKKAHQTFWNIYERPPKKEFWDYIIERRDLLVPLDVRERKGAFFTPRIWVEKSQEYLAKILGEDYQDEYIIWDCAGGTGNLLSGLTNKANLYLSTLDKSDVSIIKERITNGAKLLENHVFQFDFLNDDLFSPKVPKSLQEILKDTKRLKKLIIYINPPYAEAGNKSKMSGIGEHKAKVARGNRICEKYKNELGKANNELFAQFFMRIYQELNGVTLASFSTLKYLNSSNFKKFREIFKAECLGGFMMPSYTFDNVRGQFPIGFLVWDTSKICQKEVTPKGVSLKEEKQNSSLILYQDNLKYNPLKEQSVFLDMNAPYGKMSPPSSAKKLWGHKEILTKSPLRLKKSIVVSLEVFDQFGKFLGNKNIVNVNENVKNIHTWLKQKEKIENMEILGYIDTPTTDFQGSPSVAIINNKNVSKRHSVYFAITSNNILFGSIFFSIRHCIKATWQNDRDQFYAPTNDAWQDDNEFKTNALAFMLFHTQNRITTTQGTNHFIPFSEQEVNAKERYHSHILLDFLKGKIREQKESSNLFLRVKKENKPLEFSQSALNVFNAGKEIYCYYHTQDFTNSSYNANASLYDIKEFFQGRNAQGKLNPPIKAKDEHYKQLYSNLQDALKDLAKALQPKVYEYGFLME